MTAPADCRAGRGELFGVAALLAVFVGLALPAAWRWSYWLDEACYADPAIRLVEGQGFTSAAWMVQTADEFWAGNVPLHAWLLAGWYKVFGVGYVSGRLFSVACGFAAAAVLWRAAGRSGLLPTPAGRLAALAVFLSSHGFWYTQSLRSDGLALLLVAAMIHALTWRSAAARLATLLVLGAACTMTNIALGPYLAVMGLGLLAFGGRRLFVPVAAAGIGTLLGAAALYVLYASQGVWPQFLDSTLGWNTGGAQRVWSGFKDPSWWCLLALGGLALLIRPRPGQPSWRRPAGFGLVVGGLAPAVLYAVSKYHAYNTWMGGLAAAVGVLPAAMLLFRQGSGPLRACVAALLVAAAIAGAPLQTLRLAALWQCNDNRTKALFVQPVVGVDDTVYCDAELYFAAKTRTRNVMTARYLGVMTPEERRATTALAVRAQDADAAAALFPGRWSQVAYMAAQRPADGPLKWLARGSRAVAADYVVLRRVDRRGR